MKQASPRALAAFLGLGLLGFAVQEAPAASTLKPSPAGIVCVVQGDIPEHRFTTLGENPAWNNPEVKGFLIRAAWSLIEPTEGQFNFALFDQALQLAHQHNKFIGICFIAGRGSPDWVYANGAAKITITRPRNQGATTVTLTMPLPWDPVYQQKLKALISAFGQRYDNDPQVAYVVMTGPGRDIETYFVSSPDDVAAFEQKNGQALWGQATVRIADLYAAAFPHTPLIYAMGPPTPDEAGHVTINAAVATLLKKYPGQFGVCCNSLSPHFTPAPPSAEIIRANSRTNPVGFQMYLPDKDGQNMHGPLSDALQNGIDYKAHYLEVYSFDCNDPLQQSALHQANASLVANAALSNAP